MTDRPAARSPVVHLIVPESVRDGGRPSGGDRYDDRLAAELRAAGWRVDEILVAGPESDTTRPTALAAALDELPATAVVLVDGLIATGQPELFGAAARRLRLVVLLHMAGRSEDSGADPRIGRLLAAAAAVLTTSAWTAARLTEWYPGVRPVVAVPGADPGEVVPAGDGANLLCLAAVTPHKGQDVLISALAELVDLPWHCTLAGPVDRAPRYVAELRSRIDAGGLAKRCEFAGPRSGDEVAKSFAAADLLVHPSRAESYGMVIAEAIAHGIPVIGSDVGGTAEALGRASDGARPGILVPPGDSAALARALRAWLTDPGLRERLTGAALDRRRTLPTWAATAATVDAVLRGAAG